MDILIEAVTVIANDSPYNNQQVDLWVKDGYIQKIGNAGHLRTGLPDEKTKCWDGRGKYLSIGWFDLKSHFCDPGSEYKEDLISGSKTAAAGGFTDVALTPNTDPVIQHKNDIRYIQSGGETGKRKNFLPEEPLPTVLHPIGAVTRDAEGTELTEMMDLYQAGAVAFSDGDQPLWHTEVMLRALQYTQNFNGLIINKPEEKKLNPYGVMHEGVQSTILGMQGMPGLAEELMIERDLKLFAYTLDNAASGTYKPPRLHFSNISTGIAVDLIREAKRKNLEVSCDIAAHQLYFDDTALQHFDTNFKVNPPFRTATDIRKLKEGLQDGTIDVIVSGHSPHDEEHKKCEFEFAAFGILGLQSFYPMLLEQLDFDFNLLLEKFTIAPRKLLQLPIPQIKEGAEANLTLFDPQWEWTYDDQTNFSKSRNSPLFGKKLKGKPVATFNGGRYWLDPHSLIAKG